VNLEKGLILEEKRTGNLATVTNLGNPFNSQTGLCELKWHKTGKRSIYNQGWVEVHFKISKVGTVLYGRRV